MGKTYKHFKGHKYKVLMVARDSDSLADVVIYEALYGDHIIWARAYDMFVSCVDHDKYPEVKQIYRFEQID
ncbi:MAG: DUF1653 domain-containing protein [Bacilli bacterium]